MWETGLVYPMSQFWLTIDPSLGFGNTSTRAKLNNGIRPGKITCNGVAVARQFSLSFSIFLSLSFFFWGVLFFQQQAACRTKYKRNAAGGEKNQQEEGGTKDKGHKDAFQSSLLACPRGKAESADTATITTQVTSGLEGKKGGLSAICVCGHGTLQ